MTFMTNLSYPNTPFSVECDGSFREIDLSEIKGRVLQGDVIVVPQCLQQIGMFSVVERSVLDGIRDAVGSNKSEEVSQKGFECIHKVIDIDKLTEVTELTYESVSSIAKELAKKIVQKVFLQSSSFYYERQPNVRFYVPYDATEKRRKEFNQARWNGKIIAHGPHHDSWYQCPVNGVNVWFAVGTVNVGNGLHIYPEAYGKRLPCDKNGRILPNQYLGKGISFHLNPGDALIFHGEHLHNSEINSTDQTRFVVSLRLTLDKPKFIEASPYADDYIYASGSQNFHYLDELLSKSLRFLKNKMGKIVGKRKGGYVIEDKNANSLYFDDTSSLMPPPIALIDSKPRQVGNREILLTFDSQDLKKGEVRSVSDKLCVARLSDNRVISFSRYCTHEGADLAGGCLRDDKVICPWHTLPFDLDTGNSPCQSLSGLKLFPCVENNGCVEIHDVV